MDGFAGIVKIEKLRPKDCLHERLSEDSHGHKSPERHTAIVAIGRKIMVTVAMDFIDLLSSIRT